MRYFRLLVLAALVASGGIRLASAPQEASAQETSVQETSPLGVRITSPLGRSGLPGVVRIVAQVHAEKTAVRQVRFYVDGKLLREHDGAPPYATEWVDENPFEKSEISVEAVDDGGHTATDKVVLKPLEIVEETHVASVLLEASVQDKSGRFITGLRAPDFRVSEDGTPQTIELLSEEAVPSNLAVLVDSSQSMSRRVDFVRDAAMRVADFMRTGDRMLVVPFSRHIGAITGPTDDRRTIGDAVAAIDAKGGTAIMDSLIELAPRLSALPGRRAIILITDGYDENSENNLDEALDAVKQAGATVYVVGIGGVAGISIKGQRALREIATQTGGKLFLPSREDELPAVHELIASDIQHRYLITYTPTDQELDGHWRTVSLETTRPALTVRTRPGYFGPKAPPIKPSLEFTITDADERYLDVEAGDLTVTEDGVEQTVETFQESIAPVSIVLALDESGSMKKASEAVQDAARRFVGSLRKQDKLGLMLFADNAEMTRDLTTYRDSVLDDIAHYKASGGTALYDALSDSLLRLKREEGRRVVVVLTDGRDEDNPGKGPGSTRTFQDVLKYARETDAVIFGIGLGTSVDASVLQTLAATSGGQAYFPQEPESLDAIYQRIIENLRRRWMISYTSTNPKRDGSWRSVQIATRIPNAVVRSRGGYFAPSK